MILSRDLQGLAADSYMMEALEIVKEWKEQDKTGNTKLQKLVTAIIQINCYIAGLRMERVGFDQAIDAANTRYFDTLKKLEESEAEVKRLRSNLEFYKDDVQGEGN